MYAFTPAHLLQALLMLLVLVFSLSLHEFGHAWMAKRCGDPTAEMLGRLTINPMAHADLLGTIILPSVMLLFPGFGRFLIGWAKPVPVSPANFKHPRRDDILVSLAGPAMNLVLFFIFYWVAYFVDYRGMMPTDSPYAPVFMGFVNYFMTINFMLAVFNLLPIAPLDGSWILKALLPPRLSYKVSQLDRYGMLLVIFLMWTGLLSTWLTFFWTLQGGVMSLLGLPNLL